MAYDPIQAEVARLKAVIAELERQLAEARPAKPRDPCPATGGFHDPGPAYGGHGFAVGTGPTVCRACSKVLSAGGYFTR